jgi:hypothetical protein
VGLDCLDVDVVADVVADKPKSKPLHVASLLNKGGATFFLFQAAKKTNYNP